MKHLYTLAFICLMAKSYSQEGFGTSNPNPNSVIELKASDKGLLMPRVALTSTNSAAPLTAHVQGMTVYNTANTGTGTTAVTEGFYYNDGTQWIKTNNKEADLRLVDPNNHITIDAGVGSNGTSAGTGADNIAIGRNSLSQIINGDNNIAIGNSALAQNTTGFENTAFGSFALSSSDSGVQNTAFGTASLLNNTTGFANTAIGFRTLENVVNGTYNVGIGYFAGSSLISGLHNIFIGHDAQPNVSVNGDEQLNIGNWIFGDNGKIGIGVDAIIPSERLDISNGNVRVRDINSNTGANTDNLVVADANGFLKTLAPSTLIVEPWQIQTTTDKATLNSDNIYQTGSVAIGKNEVLAGAALDVAGALRVGSGHTGSVGGNSAAIGTDVTVSGGNSVGIGNQNTVSSSNTLVVGTSNTAIGTGTANAIFGSNNIQTTEGGGPAYNNNTVFGDTNKITTEGGGGAVLNNTLFGRNNIMTAAGGGSNQANNTIFGQNNTLSAEGSGTTQLNNTLFGNNNNARISANNSTIFGENNISNSYNQFIIGKANANVDNSLFEIGMGADASNRANALTVIANGNVGIANEATTPTEKLDVGSGNVRVRDINTNTGADTDNIVVADATGVLKTIAPSVLSKDWKLIGNDIDDTNFLGTNNPKNLVFKVDGVQAGLLAFFDGTPTHRRSTSFGVGALNVNNTGYNNTATGFESMASNTTGEENVGDGFFTLHSNTIGSYNTVVGGQTMYSNIVGMNNVALGHASLYHSTGNGNIAVGSGTGNGLTAGDNNIFIGAGATYNVSSTNSNQLNIGDWIYGDNGKIGVGTDAIIPSERFDIGNGNVRVRDINSNTGANTDNLVVADANGVLKTIAASALSAEPWFNQAISTSATANTQDIYQTGNVAIQKATSIAGVALDVEGAVRGGTNQLGAIGLFSVAFGHSNTSSANYSTTFGWGNVASNDGATAFGALNEAKAIFSTAWGQNTKAYNTNETVFGRNNAITSDFNQTATSGNIPLLQIGNGFGATPSNALTILENGYTGIGIIGVNAAAKPTETFDVGSGNVRIRSINANIGTNTNNIVVADTNGVLKTIPSSSLANTNIYNSDGILNSDRNVDTKGQSLRFSNSLSPGTMFYLAAQDTQTNIAVQNNTRARLALIAGTANTTFIQDVNGASEIISTGSSTKMSIGTSSTAPVNLVSAGNVVLTGTSNGNVGIGVLLPAVPTNTLHVKSTSNPVRFEGLQTGAAIDNIVVADTNGVLKTVAPSTLTLEPWQIATTTNKATANTDNIYQMGKIGVGTSTPNSTLQVTGSQSASIRTVSANFTITDTDYTLVLDAPTTDVTYTATLPAPDSTNTGRIYHIALSSTNNIQFTGAGGSMVYQGAYTRDILYYYQISSITIQSNGSKWIVLQ